jgi:hypothetical protein
MLKVFERAGQERVLAPQLELEASVSTWLHLLEMYALSQAVFGVELTS